jgi:hypothetical protein
MKAGWHWFICLKCELKSWRGHNAKYCALGGTDYYYCQGPIRHLKEVCEMTNVCGTWQNQNGQAIRKPLEKVRDEFVKAIRSEMAHQNYSFLPLSLGGIEMEHGIKANKIGMLLRRYKRSLKEVMPEFDLEYKPGWDFNLIVRRVDSGLHCDQ